MLKVKWRSDDGRGEVCPDSGSPVTPDMVEEMVRAAIAFAAKHPKVSNVFFVVSKSQEVLEKQRRMLKRDKKPGTADPEPYHSYGWVEVVAGSNVSEVMSKFNQEKKRVEDDALWFVRPFMIQVEIKKIPGMKIA